MHQVWKNGRAFYRSTKLPGLSSLLTIATFHLRWTSRQTSRTSTSFSAMPCPDNLKVKIFFLPSFGFKTTCVRRNFSHEATLNHLLGSIQFGLHEDSIELKALEKYLRKIELPRWHSRRGRPGGISLQKDVRTIWNALQELRDMLREKISKPAIELNPRFEQ